MGTCLSKRSLNATALAICTIAAALFLSGSFAACQGSGTLRQVAGLVVGTLAAGLLLGRTAFSPSARSILVLVLWFLLLIGCGYYSFVWFEQCIYS
jgi:hypothetical protein